MGDFFKGETVTIKRKSFEGEVDAGNNPIETFTEETVNDVLVSFNSTKTDGTLEDPVIITTTATLRFKVTVELQEDDVYVIRGTEWKQQGLPIQPLPSGFTGGNNFLINKRTTIEVKQILGEP